MLTLLSDGSTGDIATAQAVVKSVGDGQARALAGFESARQRQQQALDAAAAAEQTADADAALATQAKAAADAAVAEHRAALRSAEQSLTATQKAAADADREASLLAAADAYAGGTGGGHDVTGPVGSCTGGDVSAFPNGHIPLSLLCPVWGAPGKYLRADAEYAFDRMSRAYAKVFGTPDLRHGRLPLLRGPGARLRRAPRLRGPARHEQPRLGHGRRPLRRYPVLRHRRRTGGCSPTPRCSGGSTPRGPSRPARCPSRGTGSSAADRRPAGRRPRDGCGR